MGGLKGVSLLEQAEGAEGIGDGEVDTRGRSRKHGLKTSRSADTSPHPQGDRPGGLVAPGPAAALRKHHASMKKKGNRKKKRAVGKSEIEQLLALGPAVSSGSDSCSDSDSNDAELDDTWLLLSREDARQHKASRPVERALGEEQEQRLAEVSKNILDWDTFNIFEVSAKPKIVGPQTVPCDAAFDAASIVLTN